MIANRVISALVVYYGEVVEVLGMKQATFNHKTNLILSTILNILNILNNPSLREMFAFHCSPVYEGVISPALTWEGLSMRNAKMRHISARPQSSPPHRE